MSKLNLIWGADAIGHVIGRSDKYVRETLANMPNSPVHRAGRRYWAHADELQAYFDTLAGRKVPESSENFRFVPK